MGYARRHQRRRNRCDPAVAARGRRGDLLAGRLGATRYQKTLGRNGLIVCQYDEHGNYVSTIVHDPLNVRWQLSANGDARRLGREQRTCRPICLKTARVAYGRALLQSSECHLNIVAAHKAAAVAPIVSLMSSPITTSLAICRRLLPLFQPLLHFGDTAFQAIGERFIGKDRATQLHAGAIKGITGAGGLVSGNDQLN